MRVFQRARRIPRKVIGEMRDAVKGFRVAGGGLEIEQSFEKSQEIIEPGAFPAGEQYRVELGSEAEFAAADALTEARPIDIICFPIIDWEYRFQRPQQLLSRLAKRGHRVFYVRTGFAGLHVPTVQSRPLAENVVEVALPGNPRLNLYKDQISENTLQKGSRALEEYLAINDCNQAAIFLNLPFWLPFAEKLRERFGWKIIYDCMDDHSGFENNSSDMLELEEIALKESDLLITSSQLLDETAKKFRDDSLLIRNAGEFDHFCELPERSQSPIKDLPGPVIGYYGALAEWFDTKALRLAAEKHPEWTFVLIGHVHDEGVEALSSLSNVALLGEQPYDELPDYVSCFDVCTIPFRRNPLTEATNPVKIYEFFATGKPVVARRLPELEPFQEIASLYETPEEFVRLLEEAVGEKDTQRALVRKKVASENTWDDRVACLEAELLKLYPKVSIVVVSYQSLHLLRECLVSLLENTQYPNYEILIVDNASESSVRKYLEEIADLSPRVRVILNKENRGFAAANNQGLEAASDSEFFVLLNNDTVTPPGWLSRLVYYAEKPEIGLVGPVTNSCGNEAKIPVNYHNIEEMPLFSRALIHQFRSEIFDIRVLAMYCVAFRREVLEKVGLLDEDFGIGMFEDDDYAERVRRAGLRVVCAEDIFVHHYGRASFSKLEDEHYREIFEKNKAVYEKKWGTWVPHVYRQ